MDDEIRESKEHGAEPGRVVFLLLALEEGVEEELGRGQLRLGERVGALDAAGVRGVGLRR